jgi:DNA-binding CsgD family transcriptional regulator
MPLLERKALLDALSSALARARHGIGGIVLVAGEAGAGKSSLVQAFARERALHARALIGACDPVEPPRPFAPIQDVAGQLGPRLRAALAAGERAAVFEATIEALDRPGGAPTVLVLEDLHWADEPTLDLLRVLGRRITGMPLLAIGTYRVEEAESAHALRVALGDLPRAAVTELHVPALTLTAVTRLVAGTRLDPRALYAATAGNAFYVTEAIGGGGEEAIPSSVRDAVGARIRRLSAAARATVDAAAVLGYPAPAAFLARVARRPGATIDEGVQRSVLVADGDELRFRHELARLAVLAGVRDSTRRVVHARALAALRRDPSAELARLAAHAIGAGDAAAIAELTPRAAERAAALGAHRQAATLYAAAVETLGHPVERGDAATLADLLERHAAQAILADEPRAAVRSMRRAVAIWDELGDERREGNARTALSSALWFAGNGEEAIEVARSAVEQLERAAPDSAELAAALSTYGQRLVVSNTDDATGIAASRRALALAEALDLEHTAVHALTTIGSVEANPSRDPAGIDKMEEAFRRAAAAGFTDEATRALINLLETASDLWQLNDAERYLIRAEAWLDAMAPEDFAHQRLLRTRRIQLDVDRGRWDAAAAASEDLLAVPGTVAAVRVRALTALGRILARRGDPRAMGLLEQALALVPPNEIQDVFPTRTALAEAALLAGHIARARHESMTALALARRDNAESAWWWWGHAAFWAWRSGGIDRLPPDSPEPYLLQEDCRWRDAADAWAALGFAYSEALALVGSDRPDDLRRGLRIARRLGAAPLVAEITARMRAVGAPPPGRGPSAASRANPAGLTGRELEVLQHLAAGAGNAEIAVALTLSAKTVDHHVSAILRKLGVPNRRAAGALGQRLGL